MSDVTFMALVLEGRILSDEIEEFLEAWHDSDSPVDAHIFLGMTFEEYSLWASDPDSIDLIIMARHSRKPLKDAVNDNIRFQERIAARSDEAGKLAVLSRWIAAQQDR